MDEDAEFIEVTWGPEVYTPVAFHTLTIGPFRARVRLRKGMKAEEVYDRLWTKLDEMGQKTFERQSAAYLTRVGSVAQEARAQAKARKQG